jgi:DNA-binding CsgD family transcriptional regulator
MTSDRADRPAFAVEDAAAELRRLVAQGVLDPRATKAVLAAAGHGEAATPAPGRPQNPGGLARREVHVLDLAARGLTTKQIADRLYISPKTADHHIQHEVARASTFSSSRGRSRVVPAAPPRYASIRRRLEQGLIEELAERPDPVHDDDRRRYYSLAGEPTSARVPFEHCSSC